MVSHATGRTAYRILARFNFLLVWYVSSAWRTAAVGNLRRRARYWAHVTQPTTSLICSALREVLMSQLSGSPSQSGSWAAVRGAVQAAVCWSVGSSCSFPVDQPAEVNGRSTAPIRCALLVHRSIRSAYEVCHCDILFLGCMRLPTIYLRTREVQIAAGPRLVWIPWRDQRNDLGMNGEKKIALLN